MSFQFLYRFYVFYFKYIVIKQYHFWLRVSYPCSCYCVLLLLLKVNFYFHPVLCVGVLLCYLLLCFFLHVKLASSKLEDVETFIISSRQEPSFLAPNDALSPPRVRGITPLLNTVSVLARTSVFPPPTATHLIFAYTSNRRGCFSRVRCVDAWLILCPSRADFDRTQAE